MYKDYRKNRTEYLKLLNEGSVNPLNLDSKSNPALDIYNWDGKDELPTTIKSADLDAVVKKSSMLSKLVFSISEQVASKVIKLIK